MGLSDEGVIVTVVVLACALLGAHYAVVIRSARLLAAGSSEDFGTVNLVTLVAYVLLVLLYTIVCTVIIFVTSQDSESSMSAVAVAAECVWLMSPVVAGLSLYRLNPVVFSRAFHIVPVTRDAIKLCVKRAFLIGIPLCAVYAAGDQWVRQLLQMIITRDADYPVPMDRDFLDAVGSSFGYTGTNVWIQYFIGIGSNLSIGPWVDFFAPAFDSVYQFYNQAGTGIGLYLVYAIPEEIGWTGCLYPLFLGYFGGDSIAESSGGKRKIALIKAITLTGLVWGFWHTPLIILRWNPDLDNVSAVIFDGLFILGCVSTRFVLIALTWPVKLGEDRLRDELMEPRIISPSIFPAIFAHAALNVWWSFYNELFVWESGWSLLTGSEFSLTAIIWQAVIALVLVRRALGE